MHILHIFLHVFEIICCLCFITHVLESFNKYVEIKTTLSEQSIDSIDMLKRLEKLEKKTSIRDFMTGDN